MSEEFYGKSIPITSGFDLGAKSPLDTRSIVKTIEERNAHVIGNRVYEGMKVYVLAEKKEYRYNGNDWEEVGGITDEQLEKLTIAYEHSQTPHVTEEYVDTKIAEASLGGTTEVSQGETEPTEESVLLWIDTTSNENMVENNLSNSLITEFQDSISTLNTRVSTLEKNIEPPFGEDAHTHSNKAVLDKITQSYFDKWNNKSDFNGSYNNLTDKPNLDIYATRTYVDTAIESMGNQNLDDYALKSELPTKTSDLTNDSGYLTSIPSEYVTETELTSMGYATESYVNTKIDDYQTKTDNTLETIDKTIVGAINEILSMLKNSEKDTLTLSCNFENNVVGSAYGTISLISSNVVNDGNYEIRWANNDGILSSYKAIDTCSLSGDSSAHSYNFISTNAIPVEATKIAVLKDGNIIKSYDIPSNKLITSQKIYSFGLLSDIHMDGDGSDTSYSESDFNKALTFYSSENISNICFSGDVTYNGRESDVTLLKSIKAKFGSLNYYTARGNHDCNDVCADLTYYTTNIEPNGLYFEKIINGDVFLFLGMANYDYGDTIFSTEELNWLEEKLETYRNQRVFLIEHVFIPPVGNVGGLYPYSSLSSSGTASKRFMDMMAHYRNVILCTGHSHLEFELQRVGDNANCSQRTSALCHRIHTPSCSTPRANDSTTADTSANTYDRYAGSQGYLIDVYDNFIILKGIDFIENKYLPLAQYIIDTTPITIESYGSGGDSGSDGNYEIVTGYTWEQGSIDKTTGQNKYSSVDIRSSSIIIDSNYDYFISTTQSVSYLCLNGYDSNGGWLGRFGGNSSGYITKDKVEGSVSEILDKYVIEFPEGINTMRLRVEGASSSSYIQVIRKLKS